MIECDEVGDGYYFSYKSKPNGYGGYHPVSMFLNHDGLRFRKRITNWWGYFSNFPGVITGSWVNDLVHPFRKKMDFTYSFNPFKDGLLQFFWMVQPDGRYYADDDGFGMEHDAEIILMSYMDTNGYFVRPFEHV
ncbi:MAG: hypothetical protein IJS28_02475 [Synergistaceae bacterium]|nr:hypothetical protein [Synergistaceae bacterium]